LSLRESFLPLTANATKLNTIMEPISALQTQDQAAKQLYANAATQAKTIIDSLETRVEQIETEEPEFKGYQ
jgi:hypothetical protein